MYLQPASRIVPILVAFAQAAISSEMIDAKVENFYIILLALPVVLFYFLWYRSDSSFSASTVGTGTLLAGGFLKYLHLIGIQLPTKGEGNLMPVTFTLGFSYAALTMAVACALLFFVRRSKE